MERGHVEDAKYAIGFEGRKDAAGERREGRVEGQGRAEKQKEQKEQEQNKEDEKGWKEGTSKTPSDSKDDKKTQMPRPPQGGQSGEEDMPEITKRGEDKDKDEGSTCSNAAGQTRAQAIKKCTESRRRGGWEWTCTDDRLQDPRCAEGEGFDFSSEKCVPHC